MTAFNIIIHNTYLLFHSSEMIDALSDLIWLILDGISLFVLFQFPIILKSHTKGALITNNILSCCAPYTNISVVYLLFDNISPEIYLQSNSYGVRQNNLLGLKQK